MSVNQMDSYESQVAESNRSYFDREASRYDLQEGCMVDKRCLRVVAGHLRQLVGILQARFPGHALRGLDAGGGTGNIALQLRALGLTADLVDVSSEMIKQYLLKLPPEVRDSAKAACSDIDSYLTAAPEHYHFICFSSVLHHLVDYKATIELAVKALQPGGIIYTIHDPSKSSFFWHKLEMADYHFSNFGRFRSYLKHKFGRSAPESESVAHVSPEPHVEPGIDDDELVRHLKQLGLQVIWHKRFYRARTLPVTLLHYAARKPRGFSLAISK